MTGPFLILHTGPNERIRVNFARVVTYQANELGGTTIEYGFAADASGPVWEQIEHVDRVEESPEEIDRALDRAGVKVLISTYAPTVTVGPVS